MSRSCSERLELLELALASKPCMVSTRPSCDSPSTSMVTSLSLFVLCDSGLAAEVGGDAEDEVADGRWGPTAVGVAPSGTWEDIEEEDDDDNVHEEDEEEEEDEGRGWFFISPPRPAGRCRSLAGFSFSSRSSRSTS